jgi:hypothetical protein
MPPSEPNPAVFPFEREIYKLSMNELRVIMRWVQEREKSLSVPITVLIGGWAVHGYNQWLGSVDIDLVTNSDTKQSLRRYLIDTHKYERYQDPLFDINTVIKKIGSDEIQIDFTSRTDRHTFVGHEKCELNFNCLDNTDSVRKMPIGEGVYAYVPERTALLLFKIKASWDRYYRCKHGSSFNPDWEYGKFIKDNGDILALIDQNFGGTDISIGYLGDKLNEYEFLRDHLKYVSDNITELSDYRKMSKDMARETIERLLMVTKK